MVKGPTDMIRIYQSHSDDHPVFTRKMISKLPIVNSIPDDAAEINLNTSDKELYSQIEEIYGKVLKHYSVYQDENEVIYFEEK